MTSYSASCPVCGYEHDFANKQAMERTWARWLKTIKHMVSKPPPREPVSRLPRVLWKVVR